VARRPALALELGIVATWALLAATMGSAGAHGGAGLSSDSLWVCTLDVPGATASAAAAGGALLPAPELAAAGLPMWGLMATAMMLPTALPAVKHVGVNSLYWRRRRAMAEFTLVFLAIWVAFSIAVVAPVAAWLPPDSALAAAALLGLAALWQVSPWKERALRACHRTRPLPPRGWRASTGVARFALLNGGACLVSCWALMLTTAAVAGPAQFAWMAILTIAVMAEKLSLKPKRAAHWVAALLAAAAAGSLLGSISP
jgi:predicted metal-binding membrane protein